MPNWLLPENIADVLPSEARKIEELRRAMLDLFRSYGYELVMPPLLEYIESLLTGAGQDVDLRTFKLIDQLSGRTIGIRADMFLKVLMAPSAFNDLCWHGGQYCTRKLFLAA